MSPRQGRGRPGGKSSVRRQRPPRLPHGAVPLNLRKQQTVGSSPAAEESQGGLGGVSGCLGATALQRSPQKIRSGRPLARVPRSSPRTFVCRSFVPPLGPGKPRILSSLRCQSLGAIVYIYETCLTRAESSFPPFESFSPFSSSPSKVLLTAQVTTSSPSDKITA